VLPKNRRKREWLIERHGLAAKEETKMLRGEDVDGGVWSESCSRQRLDQTVAKCVVGVG
jgi:hypothetical protein